MSHITVDILHGLLYYIITVLGSSYYPHLISEETEDQKVKELTQDHTNSRVGTQASCPNTGLVGHYASGTFGSECYSFKQYLLNSFCRQALC